MAAYAAELAVTAQGRAVYERPCSVQLHVPAQGGVCRAARGERERMHMAWGCAWRTITSRVRHAANEYCRWSVLPYRTTRFVGG